MLYPAHTLFRPSRIVAAVFCALAIIAVGVASVRPASAITSSQLQYLYNYSYQGQGVNGSAGNTVELKGYDTAQLYVDLKNEGVTPWEKDGPQPLRLGTGTGNQASPFAAASWLNATRPATITHKVTTNGDGSKSVSPATKIASGETARFSFSIKGPNANGSFKQYVHPVTESFTWLHNAGIHWNINAVADTYSYQWLHQSGSASVAPGGSSTFSVAVKNTGNRAWSNTGDSPVRLGSFRSADHSSKLYHNSWQSRTRVGGFDGRGRLDGSGVLTLDGSGRPNYDSAGEIQPGEIAVFVFEGQSPTTPVTTNAHFNLVLEGRTWLNDTGMYWPVNIIQGYSAAYAGQSGAATIDKATNAIGEVYFDYKNVGSFAWAKDGPVRLGASNPLDRTSRFAAFGLSSAGVGSSLPAEWQGMFAKTNLPSGTNNWLSGSRVGGFSGKVNGGSVDTAATQIQPGETARFKVVLDARNVTAGTYKEYFRPVADGFSWMPDYGAYQTVRVTSPSAPAPVPNPNPSPVPGSSSNPFANTAFYVDPNSTSKQAANAWRSSRPADAAQLDKIADRPRANWLAGWSGDIQTAVTNRTTTAANANNSLPVMVAYNIPQRDCGQYSAGGASSADAYKTWIDGFANGIGDRKAVVILEPDGLTLTNCLSEVDKQRRFELLRYAVAKIESKPNAAAYIDAGHSNWKSVAEISALLQQGGIAQATGFSLNTSNYNTTAAEKAYGKEVSTLLGGKHFVIDTSRNGLGSNGEWCNPAGRALGQAPTANTGDAAVDAYFWIKAPGESDGTCNGGPSAGAWWSDYALGLAQRAGY